jgi:hypothetical protein
MAFKRSSAYIFLRREFSASSSLSLVIIDVSMPPYLAAPVIKSGAAHTVLSEQLGYWNT